MKRYEMHYVCRHFDVQEEKVIQWMQCHLIEPADPSGPYFDEEDLGRIHFILEMKEICGANDDSLEVMLRLVDQIHALRAEMSRLSLT